MNKDYYDAIFKRKSFHLFRNTGDAKISGAELEEIKAAYGAFERLCPDIKTAVRIVPCEQAGMKRGAEYCILFYSEEKENYLMNIGYLGEQMDLFLVGRNIATLWYGLGKPDKKEFEGMTFVIMMAVKKLTDETLFRKDMFKAKRKALEEIWSGDTLGVAEIARFAPSACNSQPWAVENDGKVISVSRYKKPAKIGLLSPAAAFYFNRIDIGIFLCILEICMAQQGISAERNLFADVCDTELSKVAEYRLIQ